MKVGDLVRFRAGNQHDVFGHGLVIRAVGHNKVQVFWHKMGLGRQCGVGSLSLIGKVANESR